MTLSAQAALLVAASVVSALPAICGEAEWSNRRTCVSMSTRPGRPEVSKRTAALRAGNRHAMVERARQLARSISLAQPRVTPAGCEWIAQLTVRKRRTAAKTRCPRDTQLGLIRRLVAHCGGSLAARPSGGLRERLASRRPDPCERFAVVLANLGALSQLLVGPA